MLDFLELNRPGAFAVLTVRTTKEVWYAIVG